LLVKILFLNVTAAVGGAERLLLDLIASLAQSDASTSLHLLLGEDGPVAEKARRHGATVHLLPLPEGLQSLGDSGARLASLRLLANGPLAAWHAWRYAGRLRRFVAELAPDVVHSNSLKFHLLAALAAPRGPSLVWHLHDFVGQRPVMRRALGWAARRASGAIGVSHAVAEDASGRMGNLPVVVVPNAIDVEHFCPGQARGGWLDELAGLPPAPPETVRVGLVATYARWKGHDVFLDAASRLVRELPQLPARFYVVGGPIYRTRGSQWSADELRRMTGELNKNDRVGFVPFQADAAPVYRSLDVVVHASTKPEPFGLTIAEGMACGRAVVAARAGGACELFTPDHDAVGVPPGDAGALAAALGKLIAEPLRRRELAAAALNGAARFARASLGPRVLAAYRRFGGFKEGCP
jgi:glycosyltransferase involved in cell wall biosynthesis